jgi:hypothetical protein
MTLEEVIEELKTYANESTKKVLLKHGAVEPLYGVKVADLKKFQKKIKKDHQLSLDLFNTGIGDAMYLAGLIADKDQISPDHLRSWADKASYSMISEYTVPWISADSGHGMEVGLGWIESPEEKLASCGWSTLSNVASITPNQDLDIQVFKKLLIRIRNHISNAQNRVKYTMNGYVIAVGSYIPELTDLAIEVGQDIGTVTVEMGGTACKVPSSVDYINKVRNMDRIGKKRKMARC